MKNLNTPEKATELFNESENLVYFVLNTKRPDLLRALTSRGMEVDDIYQECRIALYNAGLQFDESRNVKFSTFAVYVIERKALVLYRKTKQSWRQGELTDEMSACLGYDDDSFDAIDTGTLIDKAHACLSGTERSVFEGLLQDLTQVEMSRRIGVTQATVSRAVDRVRNKLQGVFAQ